MEKLHEPDEMSKTMGEGPSFSTAAQRPAATLHYF